MRRTGIMTKLWPIVLAVVNKNPQGIIDKDLVKEVRTHMTERGYDCATPTIHRVGKGLADANYLRREEWDEREYYGTYRSYVRRYKYFPINRDSVVES